MRIETDINRIKEIAKIKNQENWEFRSFLKQLDMEIEEIDSIVHEINDDVTAQIDCTKCANCCKLITPELDDEDISKFSVGLKMVKNQFINTFLTKEEAPQKDYIFNRQPCPFLKNNLCSYYHLRPKACVSYPHLHKKKFVLRLWSVVVNYSICPIVFNVYERLKEELWHYNYDEYIDKEDY